MELKDELKNIVLEEKTFNEFGYNISDLSFGSNKFIYHKCIICGDEKKTKFIKFIKEEGLTHKGKCADKLCRERNLKRFGTEHYFQSEIFKNKNEETNMKKYGVKNPAQNKEIQEKTKKTNLERYGFDNPSKADVVKNKVRKTNENKFGVPYPLQSEKISKEVDDIMIKKYGVKRVMQLDKYKENFKNKMQIRYGVDNPNQSPEIKEKIKETFFNRDFNQNYSCKDKDEWLSLELDGCRINPNQELPEKWSDGSGLKIEIICPCGEIFIPYFKDFIRGNSRSCGHTSAGSKQEREIISFIKELGTECETNKKFGVEEYNSLKKYGFKRFCEFDVYIPSKKICIEYNGLVWHGELFLKNVKKDYYKYLFCKENNIRYIGIFEDEWNKEEDRIKRYLKYVLGKTDNKFIIRPQEVSVAYSNGIDEDIEKLLKEHHYLSEKVGFNHVWKCYHNGKFMAVMGIGNPTRQNIKEQYELRRVCIHPDYKCYGLWSFLLKNYVVPKLKHGTITSFSDNRRDTGDLYKKLGFEKVKELSPDYWWCDKRGNRKHKSKCRKTDEEKLTGLTETQLRHAQHYFKVWDCGKTKWNLKIS